MYNAWYDINVGVKCGVVGGVVGDDGGGGVNAAIGGDVGVGGHERRMQCG